MTPTILFRVRMLRLTEIAGRKVLAGSVLDLAPADARTLIVTGQARLDDRADLGPLLDYFAAEADGPRALTR